MDWVRVGATVKSLRELRGFRPDGFAGAVGISRPYLANIEAGRKKLTNILLARMAETLAVPQIAIMRPDSTVSPDGSTRSSRQEVPGAAASTTPTPTKEEAERVSA